MFSFLRWWQRPALIFFRFPKLVWGLSDEISFLYSTLNTLFLSFLMMLFCWGQRKTTKNPEKGAWEGHILLWISKGLKESAGPSGVGRWATPCRWLGGAGDLFSFGLVFGLFALVSYRSAKRRVVIGDWWMLDDSHLPWLVDILVGWLVRADQWYARMPLTWLWLPTFETGQLHIQSFLGIVLVKSTNQKHISHPFDHKIQADDETRKAVKVTQKAPSRWTKATRKQSLRSS